MGLKKCKVGGDEMYNFSQELNYDIMQENYIKDLQELLMEFDEETLVLNDQGKGMFTLECITHRVFREHQVIIHIKIEYDKKLLHKIELSVETEDSGDTTNYELDLKLFYHEEIKGRLLDAVNKKKSKFTLRNYKIIYNTTPIYGYYEFNGDYKIAFHTLNIIPKDEPMTEHIVCFDIELEERNFERARSLANNTVSEFCNFLSVLLDIGFYEPTSKFMNFIRTKYIGTQKCLFGERFRTAFYDPELKLIIKDNMNGLCPEKEVEKCNFMNGYFSINPNNGPQLVQMKTGNVSSIEETFSSHRIYKIKERMKNTDEYQEEIDAEIHYSNQPIKIPRQIRNYFRGIDKYKKQDTEKYKYFRNACRLYNKSKVLGTDDASIEISFMVASIEVLSKTEGDIGFTNFVMKYNSDATREELDSLYGIRSKLFHAGSFSFFEFEFDVNPFSDPLYFEFQRKYVLYKSILRKTFVNWISSGIVNL